MTRRVVTVTTAGTAIVCDACGLRLVVGRAACVRVATAGLEAWLRGRGWRVEEGRDVCPGCGEKTKTNDR